MIRKIISAIVLLPIAIVIVMFAVANRHGVAVSFDPFSTDAPAFTMTLPLYLVILIALISGVIIGGIASWMKQARWRRAARRREAQLQAMTAQGEELRRRLEAAETAASAPPSAPLASLAYRRPPAA